MSLRLLSYNIERGGVGREASLSEAVRLCRPDVVILQEAGAPDVVERIAASCSLPHWGALRGHSLAWISRLKVRHHAWHRVRFAKRRYLELVLADSDLRIYGVHLSAIHSNLTERRRQYELGALLRGVREHQQGFHVLTGDFNTLAPGEELDAGKLPARLRAIYWLTGGRIRWKTIQMMLDAGYLDGYRARHPKEEGFTFPSRKPLIRLDYLFVPAMYGERLIDCTVVRDLPMLPVASDHLPLLSEIRE